MNPKDHENNQGKISEVTTRKLQEELTPGQVLKDLMKGNERFTTGNLIPRDYSTQMKVTATGQYPKAAIIACLDSRIPVETIFDQGIGDIFVGRVAGNFINDDLLGSLEFAVSISGAKLIVVLGHTYCGAIMSCIDKEAIKFYGLKNLDNLLENINPAVESVIMPGEKRSSKNKELLSRSTIQNVMMSLDVIRQKSPSILQHEKENKVQLAGAIYDIQTGKVTFLND